MQTYELRSENAAKHLYPRGVYVNSLSRSKPQLFLHSRKKGVFRSLRMERCRATAFCSESNQEGTHILVVKSTTRTDLGGIVG